ncbi:MAG: winged helix DNA-binding protein [Thermoplasmata archaeon]|nr:winged helix DNA-binding protein [Thermoplasmata archaeon]
MTEDRQWDDARDDLGWMFREISEHLDRRANDAMEDEVVRFSDLWYMHYIECMGKPVTLKDMEKALGLASPTVAGAVKSLERKGLVEMTSDRNDRRVKLVTLTDTGRGILERQVGFRMRSEDLICGSLSEEERDQLRDMLRRIMADLEANPVQPSR